ncbi:hypothetical protein EW146_g5822 [Bondarzewia mesenterica]|uniref:GST N-terminal domain-containing protein n=1 Tax=Bondarzewia mesenterica TaxID=1095465 RepID=A0A4S4LW09_9AGAM|nr:hypothetical protein EW146_g5822 [Bondarzewia mesenterica]
MSDLITLYDIPSNGSIKDISWSPNIWKTRLALNMKGLSHKTVWVEYPDIENLCKSIGAEPTGSMVPYTLPVIHDSKTGAVVSESFKIAQYLDKTYPSAVTLVPQGTGTFQAMIADIAVQKIGFNLLFMLGMPTLQLLPPRSAAYYRHTRELFFKKKIEEWAPGEEEKNALWKKTLEGFAEIHKWIDFGGEGKVFMMGDSPTFSDTVIVAFLATLRRTLPESEKGKWEELMVVDDGRWAKLADAFAKWEAVDEEGTKNTKFWSL